MTIAAVLSATTALGCVASSAASSPATTTAAETVHADRDPEPASRPRAVTLLTGDRVVVSTSPDGRRTAMVLPGPGREDTLVQQQAVGDALYVIPADVAPLVPDVLDRDLFDVVKLAELQAGDEHRTDVPVILASAGGPSVPERSTAPTTSATEPDWGALGVEPERRLKSIDAVSARLDTDGAGDLLDALRATHPGEGAGARVMARAAADRVPAAAERAAGDVAHVYLDEPVEPTDADSMPQIGAPTAWDAGYTGEGVTIAVLDSGIDPAHPDLDQSIVGSRDFTGSGDVTDHSGHGTHVASIVTGSGEASGGVNQGVAPGADLLVGRVIDGDDDVESTVIAGMEWAASQGADIVNISLNFAATDGTDPLATALNELTAQYDTLFVVSAGNERTYGSIGSPGTADAALTVGSVDDNDVLAPGSSKGPRMGDSAIKPDLTAPGVGIVAARAAGTSMGAVVDEWYTSANGTSMAAPHTVGAAAVLRSAHPEWGAEELKARLMGSAQPRPAGTTVWDEGAGRVWIPGALALPVTAQPASLSFGRVESGSDRQVTKSLTYTNPSDEDIELRLSADHRGPDDAPAEGVTLGSETLTVPAGGTAAVAVEADTSVGAIGRHSGAVTATVVGGASDGETVRTALGYEKVPESFDLTIRTVGRDGRPLAGWSSLAVMNLDDRALYGESLDFFDGEVTVRVPAGTYGVTGALSEGDYEAWRFDAVTGVADADISITGDTTVTLSAEGAMPASVSTPRPAEAVQSTFSYLLLDESGRSSVFPHSFSASGDTELYFAGSGAATTGEVRLMNLYALQEPVEAGQQPAYTYDLAFQQLAVTDVAFEVRDDELATINTGYADAPEGASASAFQFASLPGFSASFGLGAAVVPGTTRTEYLLAGDIEWIKSVDFYTETDDGDIVGHGGYGSRPTSYAAGSRSSTVYGGAVHSSTAVVRDAREDLFVSVAGWTDGDEHSNNFWDADHRLRLWQDGELVTDTHDVQAFVPKPQEPTPLRLEYSGTRDDDWPTAPRVTGEWEFTAGPTGEADSLLPLLDVGYDVAGLALDGTAPRRTTITISARVPEGGDGDGGAAASAQVRWSADDGATWRRAEVRPKGGGAFAVTIAAPRGTEQVSLDVRASNPQGSVHETTIGAYLVGEPAGGLRPPGD